MPCQISLLIFEVIWFLVLSLISEVEKAVYFFNENADISKMEQLSMALRYIGHWSSITENLLGFVWCFRPLSGDTISKEVLRNRGTFLCHR